jgi:carbonic anhydrase/acetyltransferase-like protein (isoleucine patch superfamily)
MGVIILNGARVGAGSIIAAGTLIPEETVIPPGSLVMGIPGKVRKQLGDDDQQTILRYAKNYLGLRALQLPRDPHTGLRRHQPVCAWRRRRHRHRH